MPVQCRLIATTPRLELVECSLENAPFIKELLNTPGWRQYIGQPHIDTEQDACRYIRQKLQAEYRKHGVGLWLVRERASGRSIGLCGLLRRLHLRNIDLGFALLPDCQGKGYALEAAQACMEYGRKKLGLADIIAVTTAYNTRSIRLLEKLGMQLKEEIIRPGGELLQVYR